MTRVDALCLLSTCHLLRILIPLEEPPHLTADLEKRTLDIQPIGAKDCKRDLIDIKALGAKDIRLPQTS